MSNFINNEGDCKTAPTTPGLLMRLTIRYGMGRVSVGFAIMIEHPGNYTGGLCQVV